MRLNYYTRSTRIYIIIISSIDNGAPRETETRGVTVDTAVAATHAKCSYPCEPAAGRYPPFRSDFIVVVVVVVIVYLL